MKRVGWVFDHYYSHFLSFPWYDMSGSTRIRFFGMARYLDRQGTFRMEQYRPWKKYDVVVFVKVISPRFQKLAQDLKRQGTKIIFDANINYYENFGTYVIPGTCPTEDQHRWAIEMTSLADAVVADSRYLEKICRQYNKNVTWIPDAVDTTLFQPSSRDEKPRTDQKLKLIWCGIGKKAQGLEAIEDVLVEMKDRISLTLVTSKPSIQNPWAPVITRLQEAGLARVERFTYKSYPHHLRQCDVIISPRDLSNAYEMAHTEYKIALGMAAGLPVLASPQPSYHDVLEGVEAGWICQNKEDWKNRLQFLYENKDKIKLVGRAARERICAAYSILVVAPRYENFIRNLISVDKANHREAVTS